MGKKIDVCKIDSRVAVFLEVLLPALGSLVLGLAALFAGQLSDWIIVFLNVFGVVLLIVGVSWIVYYTYIKRCNR